jgi:hypothetical protein
VTETEWLSCASPYSILGFARRRVSQRKFRLFACACCRRAPDANTRDLGETALGLAERLADGLETNQARARAEREVWAACCDSPASRFLHACHGALRGNPEKAASHAVYSVARDSGEERAVLCSLLRDIFGNPFRPVSFTAEWRTDTVLALARQMYESRDFSAMPILADALQDAGCDNEEVLSHCRGAGPHVRGCWVVDLVVGKE